MMFKNGIIFFFLLTLLKTAIATDIYNYADLWRSWNVVAREAYINGVVDGIAEAYIEILITVAPDKFPKNPEPAEIKKVREKLFVRYTRGQICDVITDLYKDPANAFIRTINMFFLARNKIEGKDITPDLIDARKKAIEHHKIIEESKVR